MTISQDQFNHLAKAVGELSDAMRVQAAAMAAQAAAMEAQGREIHQVKGNLAANTVFTKEALEAQQQSLEAQQKALDKATANNEALSTLVSIVTFSEKSGRWTVNTARFLSRAAKILLPLYGLWLLGRNIYDGTPITWKDLL